MTENKVINQQNFEKLLNWLDPDRELAGQKYESIRSGLIAVFQTYGCLMPEDLADQTIDIVIHKIDELVAAYKGNPVTYFYGVAKNIRYEYFKKQKTEELSPLIAQQEKEVREFTPIQKCLRKCLQELSDEERHLVINYYEKDKQEKIDNRKNLAQKVGRSNDFLRIRIYRIRKKLQKCIEKYGGKV